MVTQEFFTSFLPLQKEDEQKYIAYLFHNPEAIHLLSKEYLFDDTCKRIYISIENVIKQGLKVEIDVVSDFAKKVDIERTTIQMIVDSFKDFSNIKEHTIKKIQDYHTQRNMISDFDSLIKSVLAVKSFEKEHFTKLAEIANSIAEHKYDLNNDSRLLSGKDLANEYRQIIIRRQNPEYRRTFGFSCVDRLVSKPADAEEFTVILGAKGSGKSLLAKTLENNLINCGVCVSSFNMEMSVGSNMDRLVSMRGCLPFDLVTHKVEPTQKDLDKVEQEIRRIEELPNYMYYKEPSLTLSDYDDLLYMAKRKFKNNGVLPEDGYGVSVVDLGSMIKGFSGEDYKGLEKAIDELSIIYRRHKQHVIFILQANESQIRGNRRFTTPEQCDGFTLQYEDIFGGSSYAARARIIFAVNRPLLLKRRFLPSREEEWNLEEDIMWVNLVKENDNTGKLGRVPFVFPDSAFRLYPKEIKRN